MILKYSPGVKSTGSINIEDKTIKTDLTIKFKWTGVPAGDDQAEEVDNGNAFLQGFNLAITKFDDTPIISSIAKVFTSNKTPEADGFIKYTFKEIVLPVSKVTGINEAGDTFVDSDNSGKVKAWVQAVYKGGNVSLWVNSDGYEFGVTEAEIDATKNISVSDKKELAIMKANADDAYLKLYGVDDTNDDISVFGKYRAKVDNIGTATALYNGVSVYTHITNYKAAYSDVFDETTGVLVDVLERMDVPSLRPDGFDDKIEIYKKEFDSINKVIVFLDSLKANKIVVPEPDNVQISMEVS